MLGKERFEVVPNCPKHKLLILKDENFGWNEICNFLGLEVPDCDFPHENKNLEFSEKTFGKMDSPINRFLRAEIMVRVATLVVTFFVGQ